MSRMYFLRPYDDRLIRSTYPSTDHGNLLTTFAAGGYSIPAAVSSEGPSAGSRNWIHQDTPFPTHLGPVAAGVEPSKPSAAASVAPQQHTATQASGPTSSSQGDDGTFDCSSSAPYWIPDEIKHYFVHRHPLAGKHAKDESSQRTDRALRDIGRETELPTDDRNCWARCCEAAPRIAVVTAVAMAAIIAVVIFVTLAGNFRRSELSSGDTAHEAVAPVKHDSNGASHNDFLMPAVRDDRASDQQHPEKTTGTRVQEDGNENGPDEITAEAREEAGAEAGSEETISVGENAEPAAHNPVE